MSSRASRKYATGGPHRRAASSPDCIRAAHNAASRQLAASRSSRRELRSTSALQQSEYGRSVRVVTHPASAWSAASRGAPFRQLLEGVGPHRLEQAVAMTVTVGLDREHALVHERRDVVGHDACGKTQARGDMNGRVEGEAAGEHGQPREHPLLVPAEQPERPLDRGAHRGVAVLGAVTTSAQVEHLVHRVDDRRQAERRRPRGSQLDGERDAVEAPAELFDDLVMGRGEIRCRRRSPVA